MRPCCPLAPAVAMTQAAQARAALWMRTPEKPPRGGIGSCPACQPNSMTTGSATPRAVASWAPTRYLEAVLNRLQGELSDRVDRPPAAAAAHAAVAATAAAAADGGGDDDAGRMAGPATEEEWEEAEAGELGEAEIGQLRAASAAASASGGLDAPELGPVPARIPDRYSSVTGDAFHFMDRAKVPMHHSAIKGLFVALRRAWVVFEPTALAALTAALKRDGLTDKDIESKMFYDFAYFRRRMPRVVPPPSVHHHRVRAVYALYGSQLDTKTSAPLFNKAARGRANNMLAKILIGYAADPSGMQFYYKSVNAKGKPAFDEHGIPLWTQPRHQRHGKRAQADRDAFSHLVHGREDGRLPRGRAAALLQPPRVGAAARRLPPDRALWHVAHQRAAAARGANWHVHLFPSWSKKADFSDTTERFGKVPLQSPALAAALATIILSAGVEFTVDQQYLCDRMKRPARTARTGEAQTTHSRQPARAALRAGLASTTNLTALLLYLKSPQRLARQRGSYFYSRGYSNRTKPKSGSWLNGQAHLEFHGASSPW